MQKPTSTNGRRIAAAMFLGATSTAMVAGTAHADGVTGAKVHKDYLDEGSVAMKGDANTPTALIGLDVEGSSNTLWTYCIQQTVGLNKNETYDEHSWTEEQQRTGIDPQHLEGIKWILNNSFPQVDVDKLAAAANVGGSLTPVEAVEGTQAAIWTFADPRHKSALDESAEADPNVTTLYKWLMSQAALHMGDSDQPQASLSISPAPSQTVPQAGSKVAFTLTKSTAISAGSITVTLNDAHKTGAKLVDASGKTIAAHATFKTGDTVYVQLPSTPTSGEVSLTATGTVSGIQAGRVFLSADSAPSQNLILAQAQSTPVSATADIKWVPATVPTTTPTSPPSTAPSSHPTTSAPSTHPPTTPSTSPSTPTPGGLAHTGAGGTVPLAGGALALVAAGGGMMVYTRRSKKQSSHS
ncbi:TQXA domain-containing protein [Catenulispora sp. GAS73]|uniref:thioester domain-containing protein n=1 Tax=Catenulispora sp. GAS73 TaxID=3156269 RepID=UPI00351287CC